MKKVFTLFTAVLITVGLMAQPPKGPAKKGMNFGNKTSVSGAIEASDLSKTMDGKTSAAVKVKGKVVEVCKAEGCWIKMETSGGPMLIRMKDHSFTVPLALNGKTIVADGTAELKETSVEMLKHYAEDAGKSKAEIDAIKAPKKEITMEAKGILVL